MAKTLLKINIGKVKSKIWYTSFLVTATFRNTKIGVTEYKIPYVSSLVKKIVYNLKILRKITLIILIIINLRAIYLMQR